MLKQERRKNQGTEQKPVKVTAFEEEAVTEERSWSNRKTGKPSKFRSQEDGWQFCPRRTKSKHTRTQFLNKPFLLYKEVSIIRNEIRLARFSK